MRALRRGLFWKCAAWISMTVAAAVLVSGSVQTYLTYRETTFSIARLHALEAHKAAAKIDHFVAAVIDDLRQALRMFDTGHVRAAQELTPEVYRLLKRSPAIAEVSYFDGRGLQQLHVSRFHRDSLEKDKDYSATPAFSQATAGDPFVSPVYFYKDSEPRATVALRAARPEHGVLSVELNLKHIWELIRQIKVGRTGYAYILDESGYLIAHPDLGLVLRKTHVNDLSRTGFGPGVDTTPALEHSYLYETKNAEGQPFVGSFIRLGVPNWTLFIEQHMSEAYAPLVDSLKLSALSVAGALLLGILASIVLARQVTRPVAALSDGARVIGQGDLDHRIVLARNDELGDLAAEFNRMADRLLDSYTHLERKVEERTGELAEANRLIQEQAEEVRLLNAELTRRLIELAAKKEEAERANAAKTRFLASASHDLRQPMHSVGLLVGILEQRVLDAETRDIVDKLHGSAVGMEALLNTLLDVSKLDSGIIKPKVQEFELDDLLALVVSNYLPQSAAKGLGLRRVSSSAKVKSDPVLLHRILSNLLANAVRYTERGKILVGCRRRAESVEVQVWDTGIGIPATHLEDVFDEFFQVSDPGRDRDQGLGLGLSIVKRSAELLGHRVAVRSTVGRGSMFSVDVPTVSSLDALRLGHALDVASAEALAGAFVIIIDDETQSRFAMDALFKEWGCHVLSTDSAADAIAKLRGHLRTPDLIVSDYQLRGDSTGVQAIRDLRAFAETSIPALIVTGDTSLAKEGVTAGEFTVLHKPAGPEQLLRSAASLFAREKSVT